jgi:hypothetical protein
MRILGVKNWKKVILYRDEWAKLLRKGFRAIDDEEVSLVVAVTWNRWYKSRPHAIQWLNG